MGENFGKAFNFIYLLFYPIFQRCRKAVEEQVSAHVKEWHIRILNQIYIIPCIMKLDSLVFGSIYNLSLFIF